MWLIGLIKSVVDWLFRKTINSLKLIVCCCWVGPFLGKIGYHGIKQADDEQVKNKIDERIAYRVRAFVDIDKCVNGIGKRQSEYKPTCNSGWQVKNSFTGKPV